MKFKSGIPKDSYTAREALHKILLVLGRTRGHKYVRENYHIISLVFFDGFITGINHTVRVL